MNLYIGCSGWYYNDWIKTFYPNNLDKREWLIFYSKHFNSVEVNSTFYRFPNINMVEGWYNKTPKNFYITLKANRQITHIKKLKNVNHLLKNFYQYANFIKDKLGCILFQLHPNIKKDIKLLEEFINILDEKKKNVIEFRNISWYNKKVYNILEENNIGFCIVSAPKLPEKVIITANFGYIRFHGKKNWYNYKYSKNELNRWVKKIKNINLNELFIYFNNDYNAYAVSNCKQLKYLLE
jgi:uncharacterized protein YecE (DUF72 family)